MIEAVVFLGNPGKKYEQTRHNASWLLAEKLSFASSLEWQEKFNGLYAKLNREGRTLYLLKPRTFMNRSGESVWKILKFFKIPPDKMIVVHDDIELEFGVTGFRKGGGMGGHNGLRSIKTALGTADFYRFRLGVSRPGRETVSSYVLSRFNPDEMVYIGEFMEKSAEILEFCLINNVRIAEKQYNRSIIIKFQ